MTDKLPDIPLLLTMEDHHLLARFLKAHADCIANPCNTMHPLEAVYVAMFGHKPLEDIDECGE